MYSKKIKTILGLCSAFLVIVYIVRYFFYDDSLSTFALGIVTNGLMTINMLFLNKEKS